MAANYQHIGGGENRLGRHYSRFSAFWPPAALADQSLALRKSQNAGSNRRSRAKGDTCRALSAEIEVLKAFTPLSEWQNYAQAEALALLGW